MESTATHYNNKISFRNILLIAYPIILGNYAEQIINVTDSIFVERISEKALNAVSLAGLYYFTFVFVAIGLAVGSQILIGRRNGEKDYHAIGKVVDNGLYLFSAVAVLLFCWLHFVSPHLLPYFISDTETCALATQYLSIRSYGLLFVCFTYIFRSFYIGITKTRIIIVVTLITTILNVIFNYILIFGKFGFPSLGIAGSATASLIAEAMGFTCYLLYTIFWKKNQKYSLFRFTAPRFDIVKSILSVGVPVMLQVWVSISSWFIFFLFVEKLGTRVLNVSSIIKSIYLFGMIPIWGLSQTANTMISNAMGAQRFDDVMVIIKKICMLSFGVVVVVMQVNLIFPEMVLGIYTENKDIIREGVSSLRIISLATIILSIGNVFFNAVSGTGATKISLAIELSTLSLYMTYILLVTRMDHVSLSYIWFSEIIYMVMICSLSVAYMLSKRWKKIKI